MKKKLYLLATLIIISLASPTLHANEVKNSEKITEQQQQRISQIEKRVLEIKSMDKSNLSAAERKSLRHELTAMKREAKGLGGGVYLSVGAIIIIILLLILIL